MSDLNGTLAHFRAGRNGFLGETHNAQSMGAPPTGAAGGSLAGTYPNPTLAATGVTAGTYGDSTHVSQVTLNASGQVTSASNVAIAGAPPTGAAGGALTGTYPNPTLAVAYLPLAGGTMSGNINMGSDRINSLNNGLVASDAINLSQLPTSLPPSGAAGGALTGTYPNPSLAVNYLPLTGGTMSGNIAMGADKITGLANGTLATDAAAFGQIPTTLPPSGTAGGNLSGTYPNPTVAQIQGHAFSNSAPADGDVAVWSSASSKWVVGTGASPAYGTNTLANAGTTSVTIGPSATTAAATSGVAIGNTASATGANAQGIGTLTNASGTGATAVGNGASATALGCVALGPSALANNSSSLALGYGAQGTGSNSQGIGYQAVASGTGATAVGNGAVASALGAIALGPGALANIANASAVGYNAQATGNSSSAFGLAAVASGSSAIALGNNTVANAQYGVALGSAATCGGFTASTVLGAGGVSTGADATVVGYLANAGATGVAVGTSASALGTDGIALGHSASAGASSTGCVAVGPGAVCVSTGITAIAIGSLASAGNNNACAIGASSVAGGQNSLAFGQSAAAPGGFGGNNLAFGAFSNANASQATCVGPSSTANSVANALALGYTASPLNAAHALAVNINASSVVPGSLGITVNGAGFALPMMSSLFAITSGAGPTSLLATSSQFQVFTTAQTVILPVTTTIQAGFWLYILNLSVGSVVVQVVAGTTKITLLTGTAALLLCILNTGSTTASWAAIGPTTVA